VLESEHANLRAALSWLEETGESESFARLATALGRFWSQHGHYQEGRGWLKRVAAFESAASADIRAKALVFLGAIEIYQGAHQEAEAHLTEGLTGSRTQEDTFHTALALLGLGALAALQVDHDRSTALLEESLAAAQTIADQPLSGIMMGLALVNFAVVLRARGNYEFATSYLGQSLGRFRDTGYTKGMILALGDLGDLARDRGDHVRALNLYREALDLGREHPDNHVVIDLIQALGIVAVAIGQAERGARLLGANEALRERIGLRYRLAENQVALEQALAAARAALGEPAFVAAWSAGGMLQPRQAVAEALSPFDPPASSPPASPMSAVATGQPDEPATATERHPVVLTGILSSLSAREREVLVLLVAGRTNPAIAAALFISTRTVENHVAHIFAKLGVSSRTAAVAAAIGAGLLAPDQPSSS
jgi:DNA-binding NarL/FixJ family response regulator